MTKGRDAKGEYYEYKGEKFRDGSKAYAFCDIVNRECGGIDEDGYTKEIYNDVLAKVGDPPLTIDIEQWARRDGGPGSLGRVFNIERLKRGGKTTKIIGVQLQGYKKNKYERGIRRDIVDYYDGKSCVVLGITSDTCDHKDGRYDDYGIKMADQKLEHFQAMHSCVQPAKRTHCNVCKDTGKRFDAKLLGFSVSQWIGPSEYNGSCIGCYWYDPSVFRSKVSEIYRSPK
jgi:hypothetical protein